MSTKQSGNTFSNMRLTGFAPEFPPTCEAVLFYPLFKHLPVEGTGMLPENGRIKFRFLQNFQSLKKPADALLREESPCP